MCSTCDYADVHAHWPMPGTHCRDCHRSWTGTGQAHCTICHEQFASNGVSDRHWTKSGHVQPSEVDSLVVSDGVWHGAVSDQESARLARVHAGVAISAA